MTLFDWANNYPYLFTIIAVAFAGCLTEFSPIVINKETHKNKILGLPKKRGGMESEIYQPGREA